MAKIQILNRWVGPPHSPINSFRVEGLQLDYVLYGTSCGKVVLQQFQADDAGKEARHEAVPMQHKFATCLVAQIPQLPGEEVEAVTRVCWGGGHLSLFAAVEGSRILVFSLRRYFNSVLSGGPQFSVSGDGDWIDQPCELLAVLHMDGEVVALDWTQVADGLVAGDFEGNLQAWRVQSQGVMTPMSPGKCTPAVAQDSSDFAMEAIWNVKVGEPQGIISAGVHAMAPCATTAKGPSKVATVWWPEMSPMGVWDAQNENSMEIAPASLDLESTDGSLRPDNLYVTVRPEPLRHPSPVTGLSWSPGSLEIIAPMVADEDGDVLQPEIRMTSHPALMTVCSDLAIRIWVEVVGLVPPMMVRNNPEATLGNSHLCVTLVIQPPATSGTSGALRAVWGRPAGSGYKATPLGTPQRNPSQAENVLWVLGVLDHEAGRSSRRSQETSAAHELQMGERDEVFLWAVDGLMGLVINGVPNNMMGTSRAARTPRAILWGQYHGPLTWVQPQHLHSVEVTCQVLYEDDVPEMHVCESVLGSPSTSSELRVYRVETVDASGIHRAGVHPGAQRGRHVQGLVHVSLMGHSSPVSSVQVHPALGAAASLDDSGHVVVWAVDPLTPVLSLNSTDGTSGRYNTSVWLLMPPGFLPRVTSLTGTVPQGLLAVAKSSSVDIFSIRVSPRQPAADKLIELSLPEGQQVQLLALTVKDTAKEAAPVGSPGVKRGFDRTDSHRVVLSHTTYLLACANTSKGLTWILWRLRMASNPAVTSPSRSNHLTFEDDFLGLRGCDTVDSAIQSVSAAAPDSGHDFATAHSDGHVRLWRCVLRDDDGSGAWAMQSVCSLELPFGLLRWAKPPPGAPMSSVCEIKGLAVSAGGGRVAVAVGSTSLDDGAVVIWQVESNGPSLGYNLEGLLELEDVPSGLAWMDVPCSAPVLCVSATYDGVLLFARAHSPMSVRQHDITWEVIGRCGTHCLPVSAISWSCTAGPVVAAGNELLTLSNAVEVSGPWPSSASHTLGLSHGPLSPLQVGHLADAAAYKTIAELAWASGGALPDFHPLVLHDLVAKGHYRAALAAVRTVLQALGGSADSEANAKRLPAAHLKELVEDTEVRCLASYLKSSEARIPPARPTPAAAAPTQSLSALLGRPKPPMPQQQPQTASHATGQLDMSAFGGFGGGAASTTAPPVTQSQVDSGQLDMSAFEGFGGGAASTPAPPGLTPQSQVDSGQLDMPAFGGFGGGVASALAPPAPTPQSQVDSGQLDMSAFGGFGGGAASAPAPTPQSQVDSGQLDMSAFGGFGGGAASAPAPTPQSQVDSGQLDMSAFGGFGGGAASAPAPTPQSQVDSGQLDMSAFGGFGGGAASAPAPTPQSQVDSGQLDMSAFGGFGGGAASAHSPTPQSQVDSGQLDMSAFGGFGGGAASTSAPPTPTPPSQVDSGQLDMSAFGGFGGGAASAPAPTPQSQVDSGQLDMSAFGGFGGGAASAPAPTPQSQVDSGQLDMSAFGGFGGGAASAPAPTPQSQVDSGQLDMSAFGGFGGGAASDPVLTPQSQVDSGQLDMSAFGGFGGGEASASASPAPTPQSQVHSGQLEMSAFGGFGGGAASTLAPPATQSQVDSGQLDMSAFGGSGQGTASTPTPPAPTSVPTAQSHEKDAAQKLAKISGDESSTRVINWALFPSFRQTWCKQNTAFTEELSPLSAGELLELRRGLGIRKHSVASASERLYGIKSAADGEKDETWTPEAIQAAAGRLGLLESEVETLMDIANLLSERSGLLAMAAGEKFMLAASDDDSGAGRAGAQHNIDLPAKRYLGMLSLACLEQPPLSEDQKATENTKSNLSSSSSMMSSSSLAAMRTSMSLGMSAKPPVSPLDAAGPSGLSKGTKPPLNPQLGGSRTRSSGALSGSSTPGARGLPARKSLLFNRPVTGLSSRGSEASLLSISDAGDVAQDSDTGPANAPLWTKASGLLGGLGMEAVMWAMQSGSQKELLSAAKDMSAKISERNDGTKASANSLGLHLNISSEAHGPPLTWPFMRQAGAAFWLTDQQSLKDTAEALAKAQFAVRRDPHDCMLMYIALGKRATLQALLRSGNHRPLAEFLERDFTDPRHRLAAGKNAYVLIGKHRYELSAAMFILAGTPEEALAVCASQLKDMQLGLFLAHLLEGGTGPMTEKYVTGTMLPAASDAGDLWGMAVLLWGLGRHKEAVQTLVSGRHPGSPEGPADGPGTVRPAGDGVGVLEWVLFYGGHHFVGPANLHALAGAAWQAAYRLDTMGHVLGAIESQACARLLEDAAALDDGGPPLMGQVAPADALRSSAVLVWLSRVCVASASRAFLAKWDSHADRGAWRALAEQELSALEGAELSRDTLRAHILSLLELQERQQVPACPPQPAVTTMSLPRRRSKRAGLLSPKLAFQEGMAPSEASTEADSTSSNDLYTDCVDMVQLEGDKVLAVAACRGGMPVEAENKLHTFAAATSSDGIRLAKVLRDAADEETEEEEDLQALDSSEKASMFSGLMSDMFEQMRWPPDPWSVIAGESDIVQDGDIDPSVMREQPSNAHHEAHSVSISAAQVNTAALDSHPTRPLYVSGSLSGHIFLWQYSRETSALSAYTPAARTLQSDNGSPHPQPLTHHHQVQATWGTAIALRFSSCGERFVGVGSGGVVATWQLDQGRPLGAAGADPTLDPQLGAADWSHPCFSKGGSDVIYLGNSSSVFAAAGHCSNGSVRIWDTLSPMHSACVGQLDFHDSHGGASCLAMLPGGLLLASGGETGHLAVHDLRMLGGSAGGRLVWHVKSGGSSGHSGRVMTMATAMRPGLSRSGSSTSSIAKAMLVTGGKDGSVRMWNGSSGRPLQVIEQAHFVQRRGATSYLLGGRSSTQKRSKPQNTSPVAVTDLQITADGLLTCGADGAVRFRRARSMYS